VRKNQRQEATAAHWRAADIRTLLLSGFTGLVKAEWTGVAFEIADTRSDWEFSDGTRETKINSIAFQIEERTASGLSVGGGIGYMTMRVDGNEEVETKKFDGEFFEIYFRQEFSISESFSLNARISGLHPSQATPISMAISAVMIRPRHFPWRMRSATVCVSTSSPKAPPSCACSYRPEVMTAAT